jgi:hypothetical protein
MKQTSIREVLILRNLLDDDIICHFNRLKKNIKNYISGALPQPPATFFAKKVAKNAFPKRSFPASDSSVSPSASVGRNERLRVKSLF